jgi:hypothetical protein
MSYHITEDNRIRADPSVIQKDNSRNSILANEWDTVKGRMLSTHHSTFDSISFVSEIGIERIIPQIAKRSTLIPLDSERGGRQRLWRIGVTGKTR